MANEDPFPLMPRKTCKACGAEKLKSVFFDDHGREVATCQNCRRETARIHNEKRRRVGADNTRPAWSLKPYRPTHGRA